MISAARGSNDGIALGEGRGEVRGDCDGVRAISEADGNGLTFAPGRARVATLTIPMPTNTKRTMPARSTTGIVEPWGRAAGGVGI